MSNEQWTMNNEQLLIVHCTFQGEVGRGVLTAQHTSVCIRLHAPPRNKFTLFCVTV